LGVAQRGVGSVLDRHGDNSIQLFLGGAGSMRIRTGRTGQRLRQARLKHDVDPVIAGTVREEKVGKADELL
jgi:hypothetical protein